MAKRRTPGDRTRAIGYVRVSRDSQELGPEAQRAAIVAWCAAHGAELVACFEDIGVLSTSEAVERTGFLAALDAIGALKAGAVVVAKRDRLGRGPRTTIPAELLIERAGAALATCEAGDDDGADDITRLVMSTVRDLASQIELLNIRARTKAALQAKRARGERTGSVPFGFHVHADGRTLVLDAAEQATVERIRSLRAEGVTIREIARRLTADATPARGARWHATSIARVLARAA